MEATFGPRAMEQWRKALNDWTEFGLYVWKAPNEIPVDGKYVTQTIRLDDNVATNPEAYNTLGPEGNGYSETARKDMLTNKQYWSNRWAEQMNYPYWKDRCSAEMEPDGTKARRLFYEGTKAYKSADFPVAVEKFRDGLTVWKGLMDRHKPYQADELGKKDTGLIVKRYARACQQSQLDLPKDTPFIELLKAYEGDVSKDPFDALEMLDTTTRSNATKPKPR